MTTISNKDRAEAQAMFEAYHAPRDALAARGYLDRAAITGGEQS